MAVTVRKVEGSRYPSFPQREIELAAELYEAHVAKHFPTTHASFVGYGQVAP
jgi:thymidylate synthase (FAD)